MPVTSVWLFLSYVFLPCVYLPVNAPDGGRGRGVRLVMRPWRVAEKPPLHRWLERKSQDLPLLLGQSGKSGGLAEPQKNVCRGTDKTSPGDEEFGFGRQTDPSVNRGSPLSGLEIRVNLPGGSHAKPSQVVEGLSDRRWPVLVFL